MTEGSAQAAGGPTLLDEALEAWAYARDGVIDEAGEIPDEEYGYRPHAESRTVAELLHHVIASGLMMSGELSDPEGDFTRDDFPGFMERYAGHLPESPSPAELRELLRSTLDEGIERIQGLGEVGMLQSIRRFDGERWTRLAWMGHGIAHEEYHRGQIALYARLMGRVPALTQKIRAAEDED